jgi:NAD-dependent dihydropyrimidine dehydrogenase PreA subunit
MDGTWLHSDITRYATLAHEWVAPESSRCVQCGVCSFHCPVGIDVRAWVWRERPVDDNRCLTCGECIERCPRGLLRFERVSTDHPYVLAPVTVEYSSAGTGAVAAQPEG